MSQTMHKPQMDHFSDQKTALSPVVHTWGSSFIELYGAYTTVSAKAIAEIHTIATNF
jgi:hypothetical protein